MASRESTRRPPAQALIPGSLAVVFALASCAGEGAMALCPKGDLGSYRLESRQGLPTPEPGCQAAYRDHLGRSARVEVRALRRPGRFSQAPPPQTFEKQLVYAWPEERVWRVGWTSERATVELRLEGVAGPEGPVLRAYLHAHPSDVADTVAARERDVAQLRQESRELPRDARLHLDLARNYRKLGNTIMAAQEYHIAVEVDRSCYDGYLELGGLYRELRHWDLAIRALRKAAALRTDQPAVWLALGDLCYEVRSRTEAMLAYQRALGLPLEAEDRARAAERFASLEKGEFMLEVLPLARQPDAGTAAPDPDPPGP